LSAEPNVSNSTDSTETPLTLTSGTLLVRVAEIVGLASNKLEGLTYVLIEVDKNEVVIKANQADAKSIHFQQKATL
jgi:hypothetical protein